MTPEQRSAELSIKIAGRSEEGFVCAHSQQDHCFQQHSRVVVRNCLAMVDARHQCPCPEYRPEEP